MNNCQLQGFLKRTKLEWRSIRKQDLFKKKGYLYSVPKSCCSVTKLWPTSWDALDWSTPGFPVLRYLPEFAQTHVHWVSDTIQPSYPVTPFSPPALYLAQHQSLWSFSFSISPSNEYSGLISFRIDWLESSPTPQFKNINSSELRFLHGPTLTSVNDYWKSQIFHCIDLCWQSDISAF